MSSLWIASSVSTTNGSNLVTVQSNEDITGIRPNSLIQVGANPLMEVKRTFLTDSGVKTIELFENWEFGAVTGQRAIAAPTLGEIKSLADDVRQLISSAEEIIETTNLNPAGGSIAKRTSDGRVKTANATEANDAVAYGQFDGLETELRGAVDQSIANNEAKFNQIETQAKFDEHATLIMDYANNDYRVYEKFKGKVSKLPSQIQTFTRSSEKTGNTPKGIGTATVDQPVIEFGKGLSVHEQRTNYYPYSKMDNFANAPTFTADAMLSPRGLMEATLINSTTANANRYDHSILANSFATGSIVTVTWFQKRINFTGGGYSVNPNSLLSPSYLVNATLYEEPKKIADVAYGFEKFQCKFEVIDGGQLTALRFYFGGQGFVDDPSLVTEPFVFFGLQIEKRDFSSPFIFTDGQQATREPDLTEINDIETGDWWNPNEGTLVLRASYDGSSELLPNNRIILEIGLDSFTRFFLYNRAGNVGPYARIDSNSISGLGPTVNPRGDNEEFVIALKYSNSGILVYIDGEEVGRSYWTSNNPFNKARAIGVGCSAVAGSTYMGGSISQIKYMPIALSDQELLQLSMTG